MAEEEHVVWFSEGVKSTALDALDQNLAELGFERKTSYPGSIFVVRKRRGDGEVGLRTWSAVSEAVRDLGGFDEPNFRYDLQSTSPPTDPEFSQQWALAGTSWGKSCNQSSEFCSPPCIPDAAVGAINAWGMVPTPVGRDVVVALIDEIPVPVPDLKNNLWRNEDEHGNDEDRDGIKGDVYGFNAEDGHGINDAVLNAAATSDEDHGTSVASIIAAEGNNGLRLAGMLWKGKFIICKATHESAQLAGCLSYVAMLRERGVKIVAANVSLGGDRCSCLVELQIRRLRDLGVLVVAAAGNYGCANGPLQPKAERCPVWGEAGDQSKCGDCPFYPASQPVSNVISVGASTCSGAPYYCSNYGLRSVHLFAPGYDIRTLGDEHFGRTSAAAPHVTGVIGLLKAATGSALDWKGTRNRLLAGGEPFDTMVSEAYPTPRARGLETVTGRYLKASGSEQTQRQQIGTLTCKGQHVQRRLYPVENYIPSLKTSDPLKLVALDIVCETSQGEVPIEVQRKCGTDWRVVDRLTLRDDGELPDECDGDGEHTGIWTAPHAPGQYRFRFWNPESSEDLYVDVP